MQLNALFCCLWRSVKASCHKYIALVSFSQSYAKKVQFTEDNGHLSVSNSLPYVQLHYFQITVHVQ